MALQKQTLHETKIMLVFSRQTWSQVILICRVVPSPTGLPSKRCPGIGFFSRVGREIGVFRHVTPPPTLCLEFPRETGLILTCAGKARNPFQTTQGNRLSCRDQEEEMIKFFLWRQSSWMSVQRNISHRRKLCGSQSYQKSFRNSICHGPLCQ